MVNLFDATRVDVPCPVCGHNASRTIGWLEANKDSAVSCENCARELNLGTPEFREALTELQTTLDKFRHAIVIKQ